MRAGFRNPLAVLFCSLILVLPEASKAEAPQMQEACKAKVKAALGSGGIIVANSEGRVLFEHKADQGFVPASTIKVATVAAALDSWGPRHRFLTEFGRLPDGRLLIRGLGDPGITSEELPGIAKELAQHFKTVPGFVIDESFFDPALQIDGVGASTNPYDAVPGALLVNYNTVSLRRDAAGKLYSAEPQTPLTETAKEFAARIPKGKTERVNLGQERHTGVRHFVDLLAIFLRREGVSVNTQIEFGQGKASPVYTHSSARTLEEYSRALLEFSTNFLANQLFLLLGAERYGPPATLAKSERAMREFLESKLGWREFSVVEGAGLSRRNAVSPRQMLSLLEYFEPHKEILPIERRHFRAKTGSLRGISTLAGYFNSRNHGEIRFAILINQGAAREQRFRVAEQLRACLP